MYINKTLRKYSDDLASVKPAPGGGSAAALTAALGVSCLCMAANFSIGKEKYKLYEKDLRNVLSKLERIRTRLLELVDLDILAYTKVVQALKKTDKEKALAYRFAGKIPQEVCVLSYNVLLLAIVLAEKGNMNLISDVEVGVELLEAAFKSALLISEINS